VYTCKPGSMCVKFCIETIMGATQPTTNSSLMYFFTYCNYYNS